MTNVVVDKSFLQGASGVRIRELAQNNRILMSDALFYELLTTRPEARVQCFAKFPNIQNPVDLINHAGILMRRELETGQPSGKPSHHKEDMKFVFNSALLDLGYCPPTDAQEAIDEETARLKDSVQSFLAKAATVQSMFPELLCGSQAERDAAHLDAEKAIVAPNALLPFISQFTPPPGEPPLPSAESINEEWALYRWVQVQLLFTLDAYVRYQGKIPEPLTPRLYEKMEHDVLDAEQLILGCLEGSFATRENKHKRWWALLCPDGCLYE
jgi:hypothetical protein